MTNEVLISIGSNECSESNILLCRQMLSDRFADISFSQAIESNPYGEQYKSKFINQLVSIKCVQTVEDVNEAIKLIEKSIGRKPEHKALGRVPIDIDILIWNGKILKQEDMERDYVGVLMNEMKL